MSPSRQLKCCVIALGLSLAAAPAGAAAPPECPHAQEGAVSAALNAADTEILKSGDPGFLAAAINEIVNRLQLQRPGLSYAETVNALISAYCPIAAALPDLSDAERQARMARFAVLAQRLAPEESLPPGSQVLASVPLPPEVYRTLSAEAAVHNVTLAQFLAKMLTRAAGQ
jgi:hypothetical protein